MATFRNKIVPCLWLDKEAEEAASFYVSVFKNSKINRILRYDDAAAEATGMPKGSVLTIDFELEGQPFVILNGGPHFKFNEAISFYVYCKTQEEIDYYWNRLSADPAAEQCGWLKDKFGLSWQIVPEQIVDMLTDSDPEKARRVFEAMLQMKKIDLFALQRARDGMPEREGAG